MLALQNVVTKKERKKISDNCFTEKAFNVKQEAGSDCFESAVDGGSGPDTFLGKHDLHFTLCLTVYW